MTSSFHFEGYDWSETDKLLSCNYILDGKTHLTETVEFDFSFATELSTEALKAAFTGYFLMAGISYYKASLPQRITINPDITLTPDQAKFFQKTYFHGLGELFYQNNLTPFAPQFPSLQHCDTAILNNYPPLKDHTLVPLGGGKDSLTSVQLLKEVGIKFQTWTVGNYPGLTPSLKEIHGIDWPQKHLKIKRTICPNLINLNQAGAINGHVPISAIWAFLSVVTAVLTNQKYIAFSNEASANQPTLNLNGQDINHQYSKTLEFEQDFQSYVNKFIHPELKYFSLLRPFSELYIAEMFAHKAWGQFKDKFSSCNRNFTVNKAPLDKGGMGGLFWCGECPKCAFVFLILTPFVKPAELLNVFGKNLLADPNLKQTWLELLGQTDHKPFECVGTTEEVKQAFLLAQKYYPEVSEFEKYLDLPEDFNYQKLHKHCVPEKFHRLIPGIDKLS